MVFFYQLIVLLKNLFYKKQTLAPPALEYDDINPPPALQISLELTRDLLIEIASWPREQLAAINHVCIEFELTPDELELLRALVDGGLAPHQIITFDVNLSHLKKMAIAHEYIVVFNPNLARPSVR